MDSNLLWIPLFPFLGFLLNGILGKRLGNRAVSVIASVAPLLAFMVSFGAWRKIIDPASSGALHWDGFPWIWLDGILEIPFALHFDGLSAVMCLVITGVGSLIHLYSIGYMKGDPGYHRYVAYLNLFPTFMRGSRFQPWPLEVLPPACLTASSPMLSSRSRSRSSSITGLSLGVSIRPLMPSHKLE